MTSIWQDRLDAIYDSEIGADATLSPGSGDDAFECRVIDKTEGITISNDAEGKVLTVSAAACVRMSTLDTEELTRDDLNGGTLTINDKAWRITSHLLKPSPEGELKGEVWLILNDEDV
jgi:hypothetical protein